MKKVLLSIFIAAACIFQASAQSFVDTIVHQRNVVLEEFTGRNCGYCTDGHRIANEIAASHPGRFWAVNIHAGSFAPTTYPNLKTNDGNTIHNGFSIDGYPSGVVNRSTTAAIDRGQWASVTNQILAQNSYVNLGGQVIINPFTRTATITVEAYYTGDSPQSTNFLTVVMLQDSILGSQADYGNYNPSQWYDENHTIYIHMHALRDVVNSTDAWGDPINTTTQGTLVTRTYIYEIPEQIGSPNPVDVDINNIHFLAFIAESHFYVQTAQQLETVIVYDNIFPLLSNINQINSISCSTDGIFTLSFMNGGMDPLTSMEFNVEYGNQTIPYTWNGELATGQAATEQFPITLVAGTESATVVITNANGENLEPSPYTTTTGSLTWPEWISGVNEDEITINIWQDRYGNQLTWYLYASDSTIIAQGGPYFQLGTNTTKLRTATVTLPEDPDCIQFILYDSGCDGINNGHGEGHLNITKADGTVIWENDGHFGCEVSVNLSINSQIVIAPGDANGDGVINILDIQTIVEYITTAGGTQIIFDAADYNGDGAVNILDIQAIVMAIF